MPGYREQSAANRAAYMVRKNGRYCVCCGRPNDRKDRVTCAKCREEARQHYREKVTLGCVQCGEPKERSDRVRCDRCRRVESERYHRKKQGVKS